jgi:hypothetical protein
MIINRPAKEHKRNIKRPIEEQKRPIDTDIPEVRTCQKRPKIRPTEEQKRPTDTSKPEVCTSVKSDQEIEPVYHAKETSRELLTPSVSCAHLVSVVHT